MTFEFNAEQIQLIIESLAMQPYHRVAWLLSEIKKQIDAQQEPNE